MRKNGVLMHLSSLPGDTGIGTMGQNAYDFVDFLKKSGQSVWQLLPVCPTSYGDSPYASYSTFAGNPYFIDLDLLAEDGLLKPEEYKHLDWGSDPAKVDYGKVYENRFPVLRKAAERFMRDVPADFDAFVKENEDWLPDYALFMALKNANGGKPWLEWPEEEKLYTKEAAAKLAKTYEEDVRFYEVLQYLFFKQWRKLREYANGQGIEIIGDLPIYVALDSVDAWSKPELFLLDKDHKPVEVAGCPPDGFSADGQLWGNPLYDWDYHKKTGYEWWLRRIDYLTHLYNILRIDHFRGFESFYAIPAENKTAAGGVWKKGPGMDLFSKVQKLLPDAKIIAEDLGFLTPEVRQLLKDTGYPGMKVLEFAFDSRDSSNNEYLPFNYPKHCVAYCGTHDNDTIQGWYQASDPEDVEFAKLYLRANDPYNYHWNMIQELMDSPAELTVVQAQDLLGLDNSARMNTPSTLGGNWAWRAYPGVFNDGLADYVRLLTKTYGR
jgi:4-alpha-glucanotransferase